MPEPILIASSVLSILSSVLALSKTLYEQTDGMRKALKEINAVYTDSKDFYTTLGELQGILKRDDSNRAGDPLGLQTVFENFLGVLKNI
jgi:hypothetical protein